MLMLYVMPCCAVLCSGDIGLLVVDFDDTCTEKDTISVLLNAVVEANAATAAAACASGNAQQAAQHTREELSALMKKLSVNYIEKQQALLDQLLPPGPTAAAAGDLKAAGAGAAAGGEGSGVVYDRAGLLSLCEALSDFDVGMNQVVVEAGALKGEGGGQEGRKVDGSRERAAGGRQ